jgi:hypothetical protein
MHTEIRWLSDEAPVALAEACLEGSLPARTVPDRGAPRTRPSLTAITSRQAEVSGSLLIRESG